MLGNGGQDMHRQLVGVRIVHRDELNTAFHQRGDESQVAAESVKLGDYQLGFLPLAGYQRLLQLGPIVPLTALDLGKLPCQHPAATVEVIQDGFALCLKTQP
jgi:hypothetical protein